MSAPPQENPAERFPPVVFDETLYDLIKAETPDGEQLESFCQFKPTSDPQHKGAIPIAEKYILHSSKVPDTADLAHLQLENCSHLLLFFAGPMDVILIASEGQIDDPYLTRKWVDYRARFSFGAITESQRQNIKTYKNVDDLIQNYDGTKLRWGFAMDCAEKLPSVFHPEVTYKLNSKRWLAESPVKSANDTIIDTQIECSDHTINNLWYYGGDDCKQCTEGIEKEVERVKKLFSDTPVPFVVKMTQSLSAVGTNIIQEEDEKKKFIEEMDEYLRAYLPWISKENAHLLTTSLILSDFVKGDTTAINFFVKKDGSTVFLGVCHQLATGMTGRQSTVITYPDQEKLQKKFQHVFDNIGKALHDEAGYYGPGGADVMEDPNDGTLFTIDLNVRMALSLTLYTLRTHLWKNHGLAMAMALECMMLSLSREAFEKEFHEEFSEARIIVLGSTRLGQKEVFCYGMIVSGEEKKNIDDVMAKLEKFETSDAQPDT